MSSSGGQTRLEVCDSGPGIPEGDRARVLERFVRLDGSRTTPGSGFGLSPVAAVAKLHGASLTLGDNAPGLCVVLAFEGGGRRRGMTRSARRSALPTVRYASVNLPARDRRMGLGKLCTSNQK